MRTQPASSRCVRVVSWDNWRSDISVRRAQFDKFKWVSFLQPLFFKNNANPVSVMLVQAAILRWLRLGRWWPKVAMVVSSNWGHPFNFKNRNVFEQDCMIGSRPGPVIFLHQLMFSFSTFGKQVNAMVVSLTVSRLETSSTRRWWARCKAKLILAADKPLQSFKMSTWRFGQFSDSVLNSCPVSWIQPLEWMWIKKYPLFKTRSLQNYLKFATFKNRLEEMMSFRMDWTGIAL
jgi:hypothetical protein